MQKPRIELKIIYGPYNASERTLAVDLPESVMRALMEPVEYGEADTTQFLHAIDRKETTVQTRRRVFKMRKAYSEELSKEFVKAMEKLFGVDDMLDGYKIADMLPEEIAWHTMKGRL